MGDAETAGAERLASRLPGLAAARVLVVGDVMLDRYWQGTSSRLAPEAPVPVVLVQGDECRPGGAANVAVNVASLAARATLLGIIGDDANAEVLQQRLAEAAVASRLVRAPGAQTITKLRVLSGEQQLLRLDFGDSLWEVGDVGLFEIYLAELQRADVVVLSDYGKGTLRNPERFVAAARSRDLPVLIDPWGGDFSRYRGATLLTPCRSELEAVVGRCAGEAELVARGLAMLQELSLQALLITRGAEGMTLLRDAAPPLHLQATSAEARCVIGAGDTVIAVLAAALAVQVPLPEATALANTAAGIVVAKPGTASASPAEIRRAFSKRRNRRGFVTPEELHDLVVAARAEGETVAMTMGCFDILHAGHVTYLEQIVGLADRLIIAINDDDSVRRLKGAGRPINPLARRARVLAGLAAVDWVVPFSEDTPERLVCAVKPDYLIKGGDYRPDQIVGQQCVREAGGQVLALGYVEGVSTTEVIARLQEGQGAASGQPAAERRSASRVEHVRVDVAILGGGITGAWLLSHLLSRGYSAILCERSGLGDGQTICSQGIIHGGPKYCLGGERTPAEEALAAMPALWRACLRGERLPDLRGSRVLSPCQYLLADEPLSAPLLDSLAPYIARGEVAAISPWTAHGWFTAKTGVAYRLDEPVVDVRSVLAELRRSHLAALLAVDPTATRPLLRGGEVEGLEVRSVDGSTVRIRSQRVALCGGVGNEALGDLFAAPREAMQRRPLHMVMLRGPLPRVYVHWLGEGSVPRVTVTSHEDRQGRTVWCLGGALAESGVNRDPGAQIRFARDEMSDLLPAIDWSACEATVLAIDRAEGRQALGRRPDGPVLSRSGAVTLIWPTKLAFAPLTAQLFEDQLTRDGVQPGGHALPAVEDWPHPPLANYPWDEERSWT